MKSYTVIVIAVLFVAWSLVETASAQGPDVEGALATLRAATAAAQATRDARDAELAHQQQTSTAQQNQLRQLSIDQTKTAGAQTATAQTPTAAAQTHTAQTPTAAALATSSAQQTHTAETPTAAAQQTHTAQTPTAAAQQTHTAETPTAAAQATATRTTEIAAQDARNREQLVTLALTVSMIGVIVSALVGCVMVLWRLIIQLQITHASRPLVDTNAQTASASSVPPSPSVVFIVDDPGAQNAKPINAQEPAPVSPLPDLTVAFPFGPPETVAPLSARDADELKQAFENSEPERRDDSKIWITGDASITEIMEHFER